MTLSGDIDEIRFRNDENGFTIIVLDHDGEPVVCVGTLPPVSEGERLELTGDFTVHPRFGRQFKVKSVKTAAPASPDGVIRYLGSGLIKGIGPKLAYAIVDTFGKDALDVVEKYPHLLARIRGISRRKAEEIGVAVRSLKSARDAVMFLQSNNISLNLAMKIYRTYGDDTVAQVKSNPYRLIVDIDGVGFITADRIARAVGIGETSPERLKAGLVYALRTAGDAGNTCLPEADAYAEAARILGVDDDGALAAAAEDLILSRHLRRVRLTDGDVLMTAEAYRAESGCADLLLRLVSDADRRPESFDADIAEFERIGGIRLADAQRRAVLTALQSGVSIITGGPGTGKTTIIKCVVGAYTAHGRKVRLTAPTGRAAKRLSESTGADASTVHRALLSAEGEKLTADVVIVDEFSMVDIYLFRSLLEALRPGARLILVGDRDQLPSVGAGNVLADLLASGLVPSVTLDVIYRQAEKSLIIENAHRINNGQMPDLDCKTSDFFFSRAETAAEAAAIAQSMAAERIPRYLGVDAFRVQVLCPLKNGDAGSVALNRRLQAAVNPPAGQAELSDEETFRVGDKVMHTVNNYNLEWERRSAYHTERGKGVFNGDIGRITAIRRDEGEIEVLFEDGRTAVYNGETRQQIVLAYAITVHKSQGSEFDAVIVPVAASNPMIMTRNLLYTAVTRARRMVVLVGDRMHIKRMVDNNYIAKRYSCLKEFLLKSAADVRALYGTDGEDTI